MSELAVKVGKNIRRIRKDKGFSQESLALRAKLDRSYVGRIERGQANISLDVLYLIAKTVDCDPKLFLP